MTSDTMVSRHAVRICHPFMSVCMFSIQNMVVQLIFRGAVLARKSVMARPSVIRPNGSFILLLQEASFSPQACILRGAAHLPFFCTPGPERLGTCVKKGLEAGFVFVDTVSLT